MSNLTDFFPSGGGGLTPKFEEFNSSGTFTPSQALIDAGGYIELFLVAGGASTTSGYGYGGSGGEVLIKKMYLSSIQPCSVIIGSGGAVNTTSIGGGSSFQGSSAGGTDFAAEGGSYTGNNYSRSSNSWSSGTIGSAGNGVFGYGAGGGSGGIYEGKPNTGQGANRYNTPASGYCLIKWYE